MGRVCLFPNFLRPIHILRLFPLEATIITTVTQLGNRQVFTVEWAPKLKEAGNHHPQIFGTCYISVFMLSNITLHSVPKIKVVLTQSEQEARVLLTNHAKNLCIMQCFIQIRTWLAWLWNGLVKHAVVLTYCESLQITYTCIWYVG